MFVLLISSEKSYSDDQENGFPHKVQPFDNETGFLFNSLSIMFFWKTTFAPNILINRFFNKTTNIFRHHTVITKQIHFFMAIQNSYLFSIFFLCQNINHLKYCIKREGKTGIHFKKKKLKEIYLNLIRGIAVNTMPFNDLIGNQLTLTVPIAGVAYNCDVVPDDSAPGIITGVPGDISVVGVSPLIETADHFQSLRRF